MKIAAAVGGLLLCTQIVLLSIQLNVLLDSKAHIRSQDAKQTRLYPLQRENAEAALPVLRGARGAIKPLRTQTGKLVEATDELPTLVSEAIPALRGTRQLVGAVLGRDLVGTVRRMAAAVDQSLEVQRQTLEVQRQTLAIQKQALAILQQSRGIQGETLTHARNIDNKTGGGLTAP